MTETVNSKWDFDLIIIVMVDILMFNGEYMCLESFHQRPQHGMLVVVDHYSCFAAKRTTQVPRGS